jgi:hypothetical protein
MVGRGHYFAVNAGVDSGRNVLTALRLSAARAAAFSHVAAICRNISRSWSDLAVRAQPMHSSAFSRYSFSDTSALPETFPIVLSTISGKL